MGFTEYCSTSWILCKKEMALQPLACKYLVLSSRARKLILPQLFSYNFCGGWGVIQNCSKSAGRALPVFDITSSWLREEWL